MRSACVTGFACKRICALQGTRVCVPPPDWLRPLGTRRAGASRSPFSWCLLFGEAKRSNRLPSRSRLGRGGAYAELATAGRRFGAMPFGHCTLRDWWGGSSFLCLRARTENLCQCGSSLRVFAWARYPKRPPSPLAVIASTATCLHRLMMSVTNILPGACVMQSAVRL
jgi:hypothetical protein